MKDYRHIIPLNSRGFTLIEVLVVVAIIGILAAVAFPQYQNFTRKSKATEAKVLLDAIYTEQRAYFEINMLYTQNLTSLGNPNTVAKYFSYNITSLTNTTYTATASPNTIGIAAGLINDWQMSADASGSINPNFPQQGF